MIPTCCLLDTGALDGDYISEELGQLIQDLDANACKDKRCKVMGAISGTSTIVNKKCDVMIVFVNETNNCNETIKICASIINTAFPIILGRKTIKKEGLASKLPS